MSIERFADDVAELVHAGSEVRGSSYVKGMRPKVVLGVLLPAECHDPREPR